MLSEIEEIEDGKNPCGRVEEWLRPALSMT